MRITHTSEVPLPKTVADLEQVLAEVPSDATIEIILGDSGYRQIKFTWSTE